MKAPLRRFQNGEKATMVAHGTKVDVIVFRQTGDIVYVFDPSNRCYQVNVREVEQSLQLVRSSEGIRG